MTESIPIMMACDENYLMPTYVSLLSLFENSDTSTRYVVYIMVPGGLDSALTVDFEKLSEKYSQKIKFVDMGDAFSNVKMSINHITAPTFYRLYITEVLNEYTKCIYLDSDIYVNHDLTELYNTDLTGCYIAGVPAIAYHLEKDGNRRLCEILDIPTISNYVNAGVLVFNLEQIRSDFILTDFLNLVECGYPSQDQDILNKLFCKGIKKIPLKYNAMVKYKIFGGESKTNDPVTTVIPFEEIKDAKEDPVIIHYADKIKPWQSKDVIFAEYWWSIIPKMDEEYRKAHIDNLKDLGESRKITASVFGSSVITKVLSYRNPFKITKLIGRVSIQSAGESDRILDNSVLRSPALDSWSNNMLKHDFGKTAVVDLLSAYSDWLVINTHEDRFDLVELGFGNCKCIATDSYLLKKYLSTKNDIE